MGRNFSTTTPLGDTATLRILGPGDFFGELAVVSPAPHNATITALEAVETLGLPRDTIEELRRQHPTVDRVLLEAVTSTPRTSPSLSGSPVALARAGRSPGQLVIDRRGAPRARR